MYICEHQYTYREIVQLCLVSMKTVYIMYFVEDRGKAISKKLKTISSFWDIVCLLRKFLLGNAS